MKKITLFAIAALSMVLTSCNKEQMPSEQENGRTFSMILSASVNETKATMSDEWKFAFATGDKISLTNNQVTAGTYYELTRGSDGNFTGTVTAPSAAANWYAYYPSNSVSLAGQTGTQTGTAAYCALAGKQEDVAADSKNLNITLNFQTAILVIDNKKGALDINVKTSDGKWVSGFAATTNAATFDVTKSDTKVSLFTASAAGTHYIVVPAGEKIAIYDGDNKIKETKDAGLSAGKYYNISVTAPAPAINTIADVLATVDGGFPVSTAQNIVPDNAWRSGNNHFAYVFSTALFIKQPADEDGSKAGQAYILLDKPVTKVENSYTYSHTIFNLTFKMEDGILTSIVINGSSSTANTKYDGTYTAPPVLPDGALPGVFSVSASKKVHFSQGNMYWDGDSFEFESNQYDYPTTWSASHVSHLYWSKSESVAYAETYSESGTSTSDVLFTNATVETAKSDFTVNGVSGKYRALSMDEWTYLFNNHVKKWITVCGINGYALAPDGVSADAISNSYSDDAAWKTAQDAGIVFLPVAGFREGSSFGDTGGYGYYWSSSASTSSTSKAYRARFYSVDVTLDNISDGRKFGESVRLVTDCEQ